MGVAQRVQNYRDKMRAAGFRPLQIWVPDTRKEGFAEECRRQALIIANDPHERQIMDWMDSVADTDGWD